MTKSSIIGQTRTMNNGMKATVIAFRCSSDIDVKFEDGTIVESVRRDHFYKGYIKNPKLPNPILQRAKERFIGQTQTMNNGMKATIIAYRNNKDLDVRFEDGTIVEHVRKGCFDRGTVKNPNHPDPKLQRAKAKYLGQTKKMHNGMNATIIEYLP